nr:MAG TPA: hypothetical protein [Caudoviricetes sp.]
MIILRKRKPSKQRVYWVFMVILISSFNSITFGNSIAS